MGHLLFGRLVVQSLAPPVCILTYPWVLKLELSLLHPSECECMCEKCKKVLRCKKLMCVIGQMKLLVPT